MTPNVPLAKITQEIHNGVECINNIIQDSDSTFKNDIVKNLQDFDNLGKNNSSYTNKEFSCTITKSDDLYILNVTVTSNVTSNNIHNLQKLQEVQLVAKKIDNDYKFGIKCGDGDNAIYIGEFNSKIPYNSQVSPLANFENNLILIATATGSGKTITKLMCTLAAELSDYKVISVNPREDLVQQEYDDQKEACSYKKAPNISYNNYCSNANRNILSIDKFINSSNYIIDLPDLKKIFDNHFHDPKITNQILQEENCNIDLNEKKITIGKQVIICKNHYLVNGKKFKNMLFNEQKLLIILDEVQEMVSENELYYNYIKLLLLLASWGKIKLIITTATPPQWIKDFIEKEHGIIKTQSLKEKIASGAGGRIDIVVQNSTKDSKFIECYVKYLTHQILERNSEEQWFYKGTDIEEYIKWNLQSPLNRMTLVCRDSNEYSNAFQNQICTPPEEQVQKNIFCLHNGSALQHNITDKLKTKFKGISEEQIQCALDKFDFASDISESGIFAVAHGFIENVISCITSIKLDELNIIRFNNLNSLIQEVQQNLSQCDSSKISSYVKNLNINDSFIVNQINEGMNIVFNLFKTCLEKNNNDLLKELVINHNLSKALHKLLIPILKVPSCNDHSNQVNVVVQYYNNLKNSNFFEYLKNTYELDINAAAKKNLEDISQEISSLYNQYICEIQNNQHILLKEKHIRSDEEKSILSKMFETLNKINEKKSSFQEAIDNSLKAQSNTNFNLTGLRTLCISFAQRISHDKEHCDYDTLSKIGLVGYYFNNHRISGFNNTVLYNVVMRETIQLNIENQKQCIGRPARKNTPIISSSYVDSSKINNSDKVKHLLENSDDLNTIVNKKPALNSKEYAETQFKFFQKILESDDESEVLLQISELIRKIYNDLHIINQYDNKKTYKDFKDVVKFIILHLKNTYPEIDLIPNDIAVKINIDNKKLQINSLEDTIEILKQELQNIQQQITSLEEKSRKFQQKINPKLNCIKRLYLAICGLMLRIWRKTQLSKEAEKEENINNILNTNNINAKNREILKIANKKVQEDIKKQENDILNPKLKEIKNTEEQKQLAEQKYQKYCDQYEKINTCIGAIKRNNIEQKKLNLQEAKSLARKQNSAIKNKITKIQEAIAEIDEQNDKGTFQKLKSINTEYTILKDNATIISDNNEIQSLKDNISLLKNSVSKYKNTFTTLKDNINKYYNTIWLESYAKKLKELNNFKDSINNINTLLNNKIISKLLDNNAQDNLREIISNLNESFNYINEYLDLGKIYIESSLLNENSILENINTLENYLNNMLLTINELIEKIEKTQIKIIEKIKKTELPKENTTFIERLDSFLNFIIQECQIGDSGIYPKEFSTYFNELQSEITRLENIQKRREFLNQEIENLTRQKNSLQDIINLNDNHPIIAEAYYPQIYKNINNLYSLDNTLWLLFISSELLNIKDKKYINSSVFYELFTNTIMPLMNSGMLYITLIINGEPEEQAQRKIDLFNELYDKLENKKYTEIDTKDISDALDIVNSLLIIISSIKFYHYFSGFNKDIELINRVLPEKYNIYTLLKNQLMQQSSNKEENYINKFLSSLLNDPDNTMKLIKGLTPIVQNIHTNEVNSATTILSTLNLIKTIVTHSILPNNNLFKNKNIEKAKLILQYIAHPNPKKLAFELLNTVHTTLEKNPMLDKPDKDYCANDTIESTLYNIQVYAQNVVNSKFKTLPCDSLFNPKLEAFNFAAYHDPMMNLRSL